MWMAGYDHCFFFNFIDVLEGNHQWNSWICSIIDYLKGSIVKFILNFKIALESKRESI